MRESKKFLLKTHGTTDVTLGTIQRHIRGNINIPADGLREVNRAADAKLYDKKLGIFRIESGDGYIQIVRYSKDQGAEILSVNAYGASDHPDSQHYTDQMEMFTNEEFKLACEELQFEDEDLYIQYAKCLKGNTKFYWDNVMGEVEDADKTTVNFPTHQIDLIQAIVGEDQRDVLHEWMETRYKKPPNVHPIQHHARTLEIFRFMDAVPGIAPQADEATKKKWLFKSYPLKFRDEYHTSGRSLTTDTMLQVTTFMKKLYEIEERNRRIAGRKRGRSPSNYRGTPTQLRWRK
mgnify:CR=1 FL=1